MSIDDATPAEWDATWRAMHNRAPDLQQHKEYTFNKPKHKEEAEMTYAEWQESRGNLKESKFTGTVSINKDPLGRQVEGDHYLDRAIQPIEFILENDIGFCEGNAIKYITRHKDKNGAEDIKKAIHYLEFILKDKYNEDS